MSKLFTTDEQNKLIEKIRTKKCREYDNERKRLDPNIIYKFAAICYIDNSLNFYFENGVPDKLVYNGENLGSFTLTRQNSLDKEHYIPEANKYDHFKSEYHTYCLKIVEGGDGLFSFYYIDALDKDGNLMVRFEDPVDYDAF